MTKQNRKASLLAIGGLYGEAMSLLNEIDFSSLTPSLSFDYTITKYYIYMYWSDYCHDATYAPKYRQKAAEFLKQAVGLLSKNDKRYNFSWENTTFTWNVTTRRH